MSAQKNEPDQSFSLLIMGGFIFAMLWLIWHFFKHPILEVMRWVRFSEMWLVNLFVANRYDVCLDWLRNAKFADPNPSPDMIGLTNNCFGVSYLQSVPAEDIRGYYTLSADGVGSIERGVMNYLRWPFALLFACIGFYIMYVSPRNKFKTQHNLESFIKIQAGVWPVISPIVKFNPINTSARAPGDPVPTKMPLFAEALSPEEWIAFHSIGITNNIPDRDATRRAFLLQLGPRWTGSFSGLPMYMKAIIAACALKGSQKREESDNLLGRISTFWSASGKLKLDMKLASEIESILKDPKTGGLALTVANQHAYRTTAMLEVLRWARSRGGVLAPAQFLWLRGTDRPLWYALNNLGRRAFLMEGAGAMAHFMAEKNAHKPLPIPRIDTATVTLNQYMAERGQPIPPREDAAH
jgi:intracellular multiplication protein IcmP